MAQKKQIDSKTFYLYDYSNRLVKRAKKIYSPYNVKTLWRTPSEDYYSDPDSVEFKNWQYTAERTKLWDTRFEQQLEWLAFYNPQWWQLSKWNADLHQWHINWRRYKNDWIHIVKTEELKLEPKEKLTTKVERVEVQQIPKVIAENMNVLQLKELSAAWNIELPENIEEQWDVDAIKKKIIWVMTEWWHIK